MDEAAVELVRDWLTRASHDLRAARALSSLDDPLLDAAVYHDVEDLIDRAARGETGFAQFARAAAVLTPYVSAFRYPGGSEQSMPTREESDEALQHAQSIYDFVLSLLPAEARP